MSEAPFSARNKGVHHQIDRAFPSSGRNALLHLLVDLVDRKYVSGWISIARELQRISRAFPQEYDNSKTASLRQATDDAVSIIQDLEWDKVYDFCERLHSHLACVVGYTWNDEFQETTSKADVQVYISDELQRLFVEEGLAFEFSQGMVRRRGRKHTVEVTTRAQVVMGDPRLASARRHYEKAMGFFRTPSKPDYENAVKEAVCAVEAAGKALFPAAKASTLGDLAKWFSSTTDVSMPKGLVQTVVGIYAYRSGGNGVGHGGAEGGVATAEVAEYVLAVCASQIIYFVDVSNSQEKDIPF